MRGRHRKDHMDKPGAEPAHHSAVTDAPAEPAHHEAVAETLRDLADQYESRTMDARDAVLQLRLIQERICRKD